MKETFEEIMADPLYNLDLQLPDSKILIDRILSHPVLQGYYRPDVYREYWNVRVPEAEVKKAFTEVLKGLHPVTTWRTARDQHINWKNCGENNTKLLHEVALVLFTKIIR